MKLLLSILATAFTFVVFSQTDIIAARSHSGGINADFVKNSDNFGLFEPEHYVREIEYIGQCCVVLRTEWEYSDQLSLDTLCDDEFMQQLNYDPKLIKEYYPEDVRLIGFNKYTKELRSQQRQNGFDPNLFWFYIALVAGFIIFTIFPNLQFIHTKNHRR